MFATLSASVVVPQIKLVAKKQTHRLSAITTGAVRQGHRELLPVSQLSANRGFLFGEISNRKPHGHLAHSVCRASSDDAGDSTGNTDSVANDGKVTGPLLKKLIVDKWEYMHQVSINRIREGIPLVNAKYFFCLEIDWHYVNQLGFEMTEEDYDKELKSVAEALNIFDLTFEEVQELIRKEKKRPGTGASTYTKNKGFNLVRIKLPVDASGF